jgi:hypothetical protein
LDVRDRAEKGHAADYFIPGTSKLKVIASSKGSDDHHASAMFIVSEADAAAIRTAYHQGGDLSAAVELRRLFPGISDNEGACACARTIAGWTPLAVKRPRRCRPAVDQMTKA